MLTERLWQVLVVVNLVVILAGLRLGPRLRRIYVAAALATALGLGAMLVALVVLVSPQAPMRGYLLGVKVLSVAMLTLAVELAALLVLHRRCSGDKR